MFALDAKRMGYEVITLDPQPHSPCGQVADEQIVAGYGDLEAIEDLGRRTDVVTYEFENIAITSVQYLEQHGYHVTPSSNVLAVTQERIAEKTFVRDAGIPVARFAAVNTAHDISEAAQAAGYPAILKTTRGGYDGKGQWRIENEQQAHEAIAQAKGSPLIWEEMIPFACEISVVCARGESGESVVYPPAENRHDAGILAVSIVPARVSQSSAARACEYARRIGERLAIVGTFCVEFFVTVAGDVLVNEIAPRPHNSGHYTIDATQCSQYEQHVRAICGLPLSQPELLRSAVMMNILGSGTGDALLGVDELLTDPSIVLHMYGKHHAVARRKMGHFTMLVNGEITEDAIARARRAHDGLHWGHASAHR